MSVPVAVQLWTTGNYHWYLKQELHLPTAMDISSSSTGGCDDGGSVGLVGMLWDPISPLTLHLLTKGMDVGCLSLMREEKEKEKERERKKSITHYE